MGNYTIQMGFISVEKNASASNYDSTNEYIWGTHLLSSLWRNTVLFLNPVIPKPERSHQIKLSPRHSSMTSNRE